MVEPVLMIRTLVKFIGLGRNVGSPAFIVNGIVLFVMILIGHSSVAGFDLKSFRADNIFKHYKS